MTDPIQPAYLARMNELAHVIDEWLNGQKLPGVKPSLGFILLVAEFDCIKDGRVNYISNDERKDMIAMLKEYLARAEGRPVPDVKAVQ